MLPHPLDRDVFQLVTALRAYAADPFAADLAARLEAVRVADDTVAAVRAELSPADLAGLERLHPRPAARDTLDALVAHAYPPPTERPDARRLVLGVATVVGACLLQLAIWLWISHAETATRARVLDRRVPGAGGGLGTRP